MLRFFGTPRAASAAPEKDNEEGAPKDAAAPSGAEPNNPQGSRAVASHIKKMDNIIR